NSLDGRLDGRDGGRDRCGVAAAALGEVGFAADSAAELAAGQGHEPTGLESGGAGRLGGGDDDDGCAVADPESEDHGLTIVDPCAQVRDDRADVSAGSDLSEFGDDEQRRT